MNPESNEIVAEMIREKVRSIVKDPDTAESLCAKDYYFGTKRPCLDTGYFETYNLPHVRLVDLRKDPIKTITRDRHRHVERIVRVRRDRLRDRVRRDDGSPRLGRHHRARRRHVEAEVG